MFLGQEVQDRDEGDGCGEERDEPDAEELVDGDVEGEGLRVVSYCHVRWCFSLAPAFSAPTCDSIIGILLSLLKLRSGGREVEQRGRKEIE